MIARRNIIIRVWCMVWRTSNGMVQEKITVLTIIGETPESLLWQTLNTRTGLSLRRFNSATSFSN